MHYIVCGMGHVGYRVVKLLLGMGSTVAVITSRPNPEWRESVEAAGVKLFEGDARTHRLLVDAGLERAAAVLAVTNNDLANIEIALDVKRARPELPVIVRLFDQSMARQVESAFDIRRVISMSSLAAPMFVEAAAGEEIAATFRIADELFVAGRVRGDALATRSTTLQPIARCRGDVLDTRVDEVLPDDELLVIGTSSAWHAGRRGVAQRTGLAAVAWNLRHANPLSWLRVLIAVWQNAPLAMRWAFALLSTFFLCAVFVFERAMSLSTVDALYFVATTVTTVGYGDVSPLKASAALKLFTIVLMLFGSATLAVVYSIITDFIVTARFEQLTGTRGVPRQNHVVVVGLGNVGFRIVEELRRLRAEVVAVERDGANDFVEAVRPHLPVIVGDARTRETLTKADVAHAAAVVAATDDDVVNLSVALAAREMNHDVRTVVRFFDGAFARKIQGKLHVDVALSAAEIAAPHFVAAALDENALGAVEIGGRFVLFARAFADATGALPQRDRGELLATWSLRDGRLERWDDLPWSAGDCAVVATAFRLT